MSATNLTFHTNDPSEFIDCALRLIESYCGIAIERVDDGTQAAVDIYYGNDPSRPCGIRIPAVGRYHLDDVPRLPGQAEEDAAHETGPSFPFDLFSALRFWIADEANSELEDDAFDVHERLRPEASAQDRLGLLETPIANAYLLLLSAWLAIRFEVPEGGLVPPGRRCVVVLSHDVDNPVDPTDIGHHLRAAARATGAGKPLRGLHHMLEAGRAGSNRIRRPEDRHWLFSEILDAEERLGFRSTFFFASVPRYGADGHWLDVPYDVTSARFRPVLRDILSRGSEVGLHISYDGRRDPSRIAREMETLRDVSGAELAGSRHHYWHMDRPFWPTLANHGKAGLRYDSSIAFNDRPGYRLGIAYPCKLWNPMDGGTIETTQIPCMAMDGAFFFDDRASIDSTLSHVERLLDNLKQYRGVAAIDWHVRTSYPGSAQFRNWGTAYLEILAMLAADREISVQRGVDVESAFEAVSV